MGGVAERGAACCFLILLGAVVLAFTLSLSIAELLIATRYLDDSTNTCHNDRLVKPAQWLLWDGIIGFTVFGLALLTVLCAACIDYGLGLTMAVCVGPLAALGQCAWTIIGAVSLWRDNDDGGNGCGPTPLRDCMWSAVIIHIALLTIK